MNDEMLITVTEDVDYASLPASPTPEEFFLLSRLKGEVSVKQLCAASGLEKNKALLMIENLLKYGLLKATSEEPTSFSKVPLTNTVALAPQSDAVALGEEESLGSVFDEPRTRGNNNPTAVLDNYAASSTRPTDRKIPNEAHRSDVVNAERISVHNRSLESLFSEEVPKTEEISIAISEVEPVSLDLLLSTSASSSSSKVIEIADEGEILDDDLFGGDDEPLEDDPRIHSFEVLDEPEEELFAVGSVAHSTQATKALKRIDETRQRSSEVIAASKTETHQKGFETGSVPVQAKKSDGTLERKEQSIGPDYQGFGSLLSEFRSEVVVINGIDAGIQNEINYVFEHLTKLSYYEFFNVKNDANKKEIRSAYFAFSKRFHPDLFFGKKDSEVAQKCEKVFKFTSKAYDTLSKKKKREEYDIALKAHLKAAKQQEIVGRLKRKNAQKGLLLRVAQFEESGDFESAIKEMRRIIALEPLPPLLLQAANLHLRANIKLSDAASYVRIILKENKNDTEAIVLLGKIYEQNGMLRDSEKLYQRAVQLAPTEPSLRIHLERVQSVNKKGKS